MGWSERCRSVGPCPAANHGLIVYGPDLRSAPAVIKEVEEQADAYRGMLVIGKSRLLNEEQAGTMLGLFMGYGH